jgi:hypothetical protein
MHAARFRSRQAAAKPQILVCPPVADAAPPRRPPPPPVLQFQPIEKLEALGINKGEIAMYFA